ncbi:hypothetical protein BHM03_00018193 [Ensete ventricosum]|nr:hypothetical protein BHM03_00018193 [Ensete ventricosum]
MRVYFPRWEEGDPMGWFSRVERYFHYHRTQEASMVDIAVIHLEGDAIQWYNWLEHTQGVLTWRQFKSGLLIRFGPSEYENIDSKEIDKRRTSRQNDEGPMSALLRTVESRPLLQEGTPSSN